MMSGSLGSDGSLLVPVTLSDLGARPESASDPVIVATCTILWSGGQRVHPAAGMPKSTGGVLSMLTVTGTELDSPSPFLAEQGSVVPSVSEVRFAGLQPVIETMRDSGSVTFQLTATLLVYQPFVPELPVIMGRITGDVVSILRNSANGEREVTLPHTMLCTVSCEVVTSTHAFASK